MGYQRHVGLIFLVYHTGQSQNGSMEFILDKRPLRRLVSACLAGYRRRPCDGRFGINRGDCRFLQPRKSTSRSFLTGLCSANVYFAVGRDANHCTATSVADSSVVISVFIGHFHRTVANRHRDRSALDNLLLPHNDMDLAPIGISVRSHIIRHDGQFIYQLAGARNFSKLRETLTKYRADIFAYTAVNYSPLIYFRRRKLIFSNEPFARHASDVLGFFYYAMRNNSLASGGPNTIFRWIRSYSLHFASHAHQGIQRKFVTSRTFTAGFITVILPWLGLQVFYGKQFFLVSLGLEKTAFYERHIAFYSDYLALDKLLPKDATILVTDFIIDSVYMPRPVVFDGSEFASPRTCFLVRTEPKRLHRG